MTKKKTKEQFIKEARAVHGDFYDYSKVDYVDSYTNVTITCPIHGDFPQTPKSHLHGSRCPDCAMESSTKNRSFTREQFIAKAIEKHGDKYDYSKVKYVNTMTKVVIGCPIHGDIKITPSEHIRTVGCGKCGRIKGHKSLLKTTEQFIEEARAVHGDYYDYSKVNYVDAKTPVIITCPVHGDFPQKPYLHLQGHGCWPCSKGIMTEAEFIEKARAKFGDRFDYSLVKITGNQTKVKIICPVHGVIEQTPYNHLKCKSGCYKCSGLGGYTTEDFIRLSKERNGDRYDYSLTEYKGSLEDVTLICRKHGPFKVNAENHLHHGQGCRICNLGSRTTEEFIEDARKVHGDYYDYSKSVYMGIEKPIIITCPKHGDFETTPHEHLRGGNCAKCNMSRGEERVELYLQRHNVKYIHCKDIKSPLATGPKKIFNVDFALLDDKDDIYMIIEYNGRQHYESIAFMGGDENFDAQQARDAALRRYCHEEKIRLLEIPYTDFDRIEEILEQEL